MLALYKHLDKTTVCIDKTWLMNCALQINKKQFWEGGDRSSYCTVPDEFGEAVTTVVLEEDAAMVKEDVGCTRKMAGDYTSISIKIYAFQTNPNGV